MAAAGRGRARGRSKVTIDDVKEVSSPGGLQDRVAGGGGGDETQLSSESNGNSSNNNNSANKQTAGPTLLLSDMKTIIEDPRTYASQYDVKKVLMCARHFVKSEEDVKALASLIYTKCLSDSSIAKRGSEICDCLTSIEAGSAKFRNCLLSLVQTDYKARKELITTDPSRFTAFLAFLCEMFGVMRTVTDEVFRPLVSPIFDCFDLILDPEETGEVGDLDLLNEDVCEIFSDQLSKVGRLLADNDDADRMRSLMNKIRTCIIHSKSSPRVRCSLLEVLESYIRGWEDADNETHMFYCDTAMDIISGLAIS